MSLTNEQLAELIQQGNDELKPVLWERVKRLLYSFAGKYYYRYTEYCERCGVSEWDLRQQAYCAYEDSIASFDSSRGSYNTYLGFMFKKCLRGAFHKVKDPLNSADSIDRSVGEDSEDKDSTLSDFIADPKTNNAFEQVDQADIAAYLRSAVECLPDMEKDVIKRHYFNQQSLKSIAELYGVSDQDILMCSRRGIAALRRNKQLCRLINTHN